MFKTQNMVEKFCCAGSSNRRVRIAHHWSCERRSSRSWQSRGGMGRV